MGAGKLRSYVLPNELKGIQALDLYPKQKIVDPRTGFEVRIGERVPGSPVVLAAIGEDFIVLLPVDSDKHSTVESLIGSRRDNGFSLDIEFDPETIPNCRRVR